jgi:hypothetical protein
MEKLNTTNPSNEFFELYWDIEHLKNRDIDYDVWMEEGDSWYLRTLFQTAPLVTLPEKTEFEGWQFLLKDSDYPYSREQFPIMSKRMLETLRSVKDFPHQAIPIEVEDIQAFWNESEKDFLRSGISNTDYVLVQLLEHQDIFDFEKSEYNMIEDLPGKVESVRRVSIKEPEDGLPSLFRISAMISTTFFVSKEAKAALEAADIKGVKLL